MKKIFNIIILAVFTIFIFSCDFEAAINLLSKTSTNIFVANSGAEENAQRAVDAISGNFENFETTLVDVGDAIDKAVADFKAGDIDFPEALNNIFEPFRLDKETMDEILKSSARAGLTDEGAKKFAKQLDNCVIDLSETLDIDGAIKSALDGMSQCLKKMNMNEEAVDTLMGLVDEMLDEEGDDLFVVSCSDILITSMLATSICDIADAIKNKDLTDGSSSSDIQSAILSDTQVISEVAGVFQVASTIYDGCKMQNIAQSPLISALAEVASLFGKYLPV